MESIQSPYWDGNSHSSLTALFSKVFLSFFFFFNLISLAASVLVVALVILIAACGIFHCGTWASLAEACRLRILTVTLRLSCPAVHGLLVPWPGIKSWSPALEGGFLTTGPPGKPQWSFSKAFLSLNSCLFMMWGMGLRTMKLSFLPFPLKSPPCGMS